MEERAMFTNLSPGAIGVKASLIEGIKLARSTGFQGLEFNVQELARLIDEKGVDEVKGLFEEADVRPGGWGLPVDWRGGEASYRDSLSVLPRFAQVGSSIGSLRVATWILPFSDERPFDENFEWHVKRFEPIARRLGEYGCSLGLEFVGPRTSRVGRRYEFIHTLDGMLALCKTIGTGNVGLLLDSWHWYTSHGTLEDLQKLKASDVVYVHVNDAPAAIAVDEQVDNVRCLPGETGVIDLTGFLKRLEDIGYDGPVTPEPFSQKLRGLTPTEAAQVTHDALSKVWKEAELG